MVRLKFNKELEKTILTAQIQGRDWKREMYRVLLNHRTTPHLTTKYSPVKILPIGEICMNKPTTVDQNNSY